MEPITGVQCECPLGPVLTVLGGPKGAPLSSSIGIWKSMAEVKVTRLKCLRCGYEWFPRQEDVRICPKCRTAWWDRPKGKRETARGGG